MNADWADERGFKSKIEIKKKLGADLWFISARPLDLRSSASHSFAWQKACRGGGASGAIADWGEFSESAGRS